MLDGVNANFKQETTVPQDIPETESQKNETSIWSKYDSASVGGDANGIIEQEELCYFINDKSNEYGMNRGDINLRVGEEFTRLAHNMVGERWQNAYAILDNIARLAVNNIKGQVAAETDTEATQIPTQQSKYDWHNYDGETVGGIADGIIDEAELNNFINDISNKYGMNIGDTNIRVGNEFKRLAQNFVGENWNNSEAILEKIAILAINNIRGQVAAETGTEPTQIPNEPFGL